MDEMRKALLLLKNHKASGCDRISAEYLKAFTESFGDILLKIVQELFSKKVYPTEWTSNFLKPIYKKGDSVDPDNYRGLAIGSTSKTIQLNTLRQTDGIHQEKRPSLSKSDWLHDLHFRPHISSPDNHRKSCKKE